MYSLKTEKQKHKYTGDLREKCADKLRQRHEAKAIAEMASEREAGKKAAKIMSIF